MKPIPYRNLLIHRASEQIANMAWMDRGMVENLATGESGMVATLCVLGSAHAAISHVLKEACSRIGRGQWRD